MNALAVQALLICALLVAVGYLFARSVLRGKRIKTRTRTRHFGPISWSIRGLTDVRSAYIRLPLGKRFVLFEKPPVRRQRP